MQIANYFFYQTKHVSERMQQRSFKNADIDLIAHCGTYIGDDEVFLSNKDADREIRFLKELIKKLDRLRNKKIVVRNNALVTAYPCQKSELGRIRRRSCQKTN
jgi:hypothetical protein